MTELQAAIDRVHNLIREMAEDGLSDAAIFAALGQATAETAIQLSASDSFLDDCVEDIRVMMTRAKERMAKP